MRFPTRTYRNSADPPNSGRERGSRAVRQEPLSFSWNREKEGGWGMDEGETQPITTRQEGRHAFRYDRRSPLSPEGEGLGVRRSATLKHPPRPTPIAPQPKGAQ